MKESSAVMKGDPITVTPLLLLLLLFLTKINSKRLKIILLPPKERLIPLRIP